MTVKIDVVRRVADVAGLEADWSRLLARSAHRSPFQSWDYVFAWLKCYGDHYETRVLVARDETEVVGIAPFVIGPGNSLKRRALRHLAFAGGLGDSVSEFQDLIVPQGEEKRVAPAMAHALAESLGREWDILALSLVPEGSKALDALSDALAGHGVALQTLRHHAAQYAAIGPDWSTYLSGRSRNLRKSLRNRRNRLNKDHDCRILEAGRDISIAEAVGMLALLNKERWGEEGRAFRSGAFEAFHLGLAESLIPKGNLAVAVMTIDGRPAAAEYDLLHDGRAWGMVSGWAREFADLGPGQILTVEMLERYSSRGLTEYDFLAGSARYKDDWASGERLLVDLEAMNPRSLRAGAFSALRQARALLKAPFGGTRQAVESLHKAGA